MKEVRRSFAKAAICYDAVAKIQIEIGQRLIERLDYFKIEPTRILDLGCGTGYFSSDLKKRYPKAQIVSVDLTHSMLLESKAKQSWRKKWHNVNADASNLPFLQDSFDLIFSNQMMHWVNPIDDFFKEVTRVLSPTGALLFSTLGPDTFTEIVSAWQHTDYQHVNHFYDMHDVGDKLLHNNFSDPVVDMETITLKYRDVYSLLHDLKQQGVKNINRARNQGLTGKSQWKTFISQYEQLKDSNGLIPLTYEVIYGQAWGKQAPQNSGEIRVPASSISISKPRI